MSLLYQWLARAAEGHSLDKALLADGGYLSWRGLLKRADDRAGELQRMGIGKGDWVGLQLGNSTNFVILALGVSKLGAVVVPIDPQTDSETLDHLRETFALRAVVAPSLGRSPEIRSSVGAERLRGTMLWCLSFERCPSLYRPRGEGELALVLFETDSLRRWRAVGHMEESLERTAKTVVEHFDVDETQPLLSAFPATAGIAWDLTLLPALRAGAALVVGDDPSVPGAGRALHREISGAFEQSLGLAATQLVGDWSPPVRLEKQAALNPGFDEPRGSLGGDRVPSRRPKVSQQYVFAHRALRARFCREPAEFIDLLEEREGYLSGLWEIVGDETGGSAEAELRAVISKTPDDSALALVALPVAVKRGEAIFVAMVAPATGQGKPPRYITLEKAGRGTMLREWDREGQHRNHGEGPEPDLPSFTASVMQLL